MPMIGSRSKYYNKLQYNTDSTSHSNRVSSHNVGVTSRVRVIQGLRLELSRESLKHDSSRDLSRVMSRESTALTYELRTKEVKRISLEISTQVLTY